MRHVSKHPFERQRHVRHPESAGLAEDVNNSILESGDAADPRSTLYRSEC